MLGNDTVSVYLKMPLPVSSLVSDTEVTCLLAISMYIYTMDRLPKDLSAAVIGYLEVGVGLMALRLVSRGWRGMVESLKEDISRGVDREKERAESTKVVIAGAKINCVEVFEMQMRGLYLCQSQIDAFRSQDISHLHRDSALSLTGLFLILENKSTLPERPQLEYLARYTKCPLFTSRLSEISPSRLRPETFSTLKILVQDADFLRVRDGLPSLSNAIANWVSMFYSYALTTFTIKKLTNDTKALEERLHSLQQLAYWLNLADD